MFCYCCILFFFFKQKTAYEMRISDWSSDVCSSDLECRFPACWRTPALTARRRRLRNTKCRCGRTERPILLAWPARSQRPESEAHRCQTRRAVAHRSSAGADKIGRATCRERVCQYVKVTGVAGSLKTKKNTYIQKD